MLQMYNRQRNRDRGYLLFSKDELEVRRVQAQDLQQIENGKEEVKQAVPKVAQEIVQGSINCHASASKDSGL